MNTNMRWYDTIDRASIVDLPMSSYFAETEKSIKGEWSFQKWLESVDQDTLAMLEKYMNNLDEKFEVNQDESDDLLTLLTLALGREGAFDKDPDNEELMKTMVDDNVSSLFGMVVMEGLRRKGFVTVKGNGRLTGNVKYSLTAKGKVMQDHIREDGKTKDNKAATDILSALFPDQRN